MKITKITVDFDSGAVLEYQDPKGVNLGDIPAMIGLSAGDIVDAEAGTPQAAIMTLLSFGLSFVANKYGIPF